MMLRITEIDSSEGAFTLHLEGWVAEHTVAELDAACETALARGVSLVLDLRDVRFVDGAGASSLRELRERGCALAGASPFVLEMIERGGAETALEPNARALAPRDDHASSEEEELLRELRSGSEAAFETLVRRNAAALLAVARRFLPNEEDARDAVQEAFASAFKALPTFAGGAKLSTWLHRIVVNAALMKLRSRRRRPEESIDDLLPCFDESGEWVSASTSHVGPTESEVESRELRTIVRRAIDRLPETFRTVLLLRDIDELDTEETAAVLGVTPNAVKIRLHRARQALRTLLERELADGSDGSGDELAGSERPTRGSTRGGGAVLAYA